MNCFTVEILDSEIKTIEVETCIADSASNIEIINYSESSIDINSCPIVYNADIANVIESIIDAGSGISTVSSGNNIIISVSGLTSSFINDFNEAVDDRVGNGLLTAGSGIDLNYNDSTNSLVISTIPITGVYALLSGADFTGEVTAPSIDADMVYVNGVAVSVSGHSHVIPDVDMLESVLDNKLDLDDTIEGGFF